MRCTALLSTSARQRLLATAFDLGFRYFDTAPSYGGGLAEREIGAFAATRRSQLVLTTKFGIYSGRLAALPPYVTAALRMASRLVRGGRGAGGPPPRDYDPDRARVSLENSLRALRTDHVDVLYLHEPELALLGDCDRLARALESFRASRQSAVLRPLRTGSRKHPDCLSVCADCRSHPERIEGWPRRPAAGVTDLGRPERSVVLGVSRGRGAARRSGRDDPGSRPCGLSRGSAHALYAWPGSDRAVRGSRRPSLRILPAASRLGRAEWLYNV
ncbi:MAG: aldo/keto reductase [Gammaproteobacteria bacterium]